MSGTSSIGIVKDDTFAMIKNKKKSTLMIPKNKVYYDSKESAITMTDDTCSFYADNNIKYKP